VVKWQSKTIAH